LGIAIKNGFRDSGIGTEVMKMMIEQARTLGLKALTLEAFATNKRAIHVYENMGFVETGGIPKEHFKENQYMDGVIMTKLIGCARFCLLDKSACTKYRDSNPKKGNNQSNPTC